MRFLTLIILLNFASGFAQESVDTVLIITDVWDEVEYTQEDKIYNRSVWTFVDNPALAGFDRKLAVAYRFRMKNLAMGVPNDEGNLELAFMQHEAFIDLSLGGEKQNWGTAIYYSNEKELQHNIQKIISASSFRVNMKDHHLIFGVKMTMQFSKLNDWDKLTFIDMFDPRYGHVYQTNEVRPNSTYNFLYFGGGLRYYWKRFAFDYSVEWKSTEGWALSQIPTSVLRNKLKAVYHFNVGDGVTISPEAALDIKSTGNDFAFFSGFVTISYLDKFYGQLGMADLNRFTFRGGYQLKNYLIIEVGGASYLNENMKKIAGLAAVDVGIRYQIRPWFR